MVVTAAIGDDPGKGEAMPTAERECVVCRQVTPHEITGPVGAATFACLRCRELDAEAAVLARQSTRSQEVAWRAQGMANRAAQAKAWPSSKVGALVGGIMLAVGCFLPWITIAALGTEISRSGVDLTSEDAAIMVIGGVAMAALAATGKLVGPARFVCSLVGLGGGALAALHWHQMNERVQAVNLDSPGMATVGFGLYICAGGCLALLVAPWVKN